MERANEALDKEMQAYQQRVDEYINRADEAVAYAEKMSAEVQEGYRDLLLQVKAAIEKKSHKDEGENK